MLKCSKCKSKIVTGQKFTLLSIVTNTGESGPVGPMFDLEEFYKSMKIVCQHCANKVNKLVPVEDDRFAPTKSAIQQVGGWSTGDDNILYEILDNFNELDIGDCVKMFLERKKELASA